MNSVTLQAKIIKIDESDALYYKQNLIGQTGKFEFALDSPMHGVGWYSGYFTPCGDGITLYFWRVKLRILEDT